MSGVFPSMLSIVHPAHLVALCGVGTQPSGASMGHPFATPADTCAMAAPKASVMPVSGLRDLLHRYDVLLLDQLGVLHDGKNVHSSAWDAARRFQEVPGRNNKLVLASNSSRSATVALQGLKKMGCDADLLDGVVTSGEVSHRWLNKRKMERLNDKNADRSKRTEDGPDENPSNVANGESYDDLEDVVHMTWQWRGHQSLQELGVRGVSEKEMHKANLMVSQGADAIADGEEIIPMEDDQMERLVLKCAEKKMVMLCTNPDMVAQYGKELAKMPGFYAELYEKAGGTVIRTGKPESVFYDFCMEVIQELRNGEPVDRSRVLAIGDSMAHDVMGANNAGIDVLFVQGGIHYQDLGIKLGEEAALKSVIELAQKYGVQPTYTIPMLRW